MVIYHTLTRGADIKGCSISSSLPSSLVLVQTTVPGWIRSSWTPNGRSTPVVFFVPTSPGRRTKRHPQSCSTQTRGRLYGLEFPQTPICNEVRCVCTLRRDAHITDNVPGSTNTFPTTLAYSAPLSPTEASWAAWPSSGLATARTTALFMSQPTDHRRPVVYVYGVHAVQPPHTVPVRTRNPLSTYHSCDSFESWFRHYPQAMPHPNADRWTPIIKNQTSRPGLVLFFSWRRAG